MVVIKLRKHSYLEKMQAGCDCLSIKKIQKESLTLK